MTWDEMFTRDRQPSLDDIEAYAGTFAPVWTDLLAYFETAYKCVPKLTYSGCSMPGWNLKFQKSTAAFGTWYPKPDAFDCMFVWSYKLDDDMMNLVPTLTPMMAERVTNAHDFMKNGRFMMFHVNTRDIVEDYKRMCAVKKAPIIK